jgi:hypothetical protein
LPPHPAHEPDLPHSTAGRLRQIKRREGRALARV